MSELDKFVRNEMFPSPRAVFEDSVRPLEEIRDSCIFVLDTNALLVPFYANNQNLDEIKNVLKEVVSQNRLKIPGQVAREFAANRPEQIKNIYQQLSQRREKFIPFQGSVYPLLSGDEDYEELQKIEREFLDYAKEASEKYGAAVRKVLDRIIGWAWNDPVSLIYRELFTDSVFCDPDFDRSKVIEELEYRFAHSIPPGYKDKGKDDDGIGDYLIWKAILDIGETRQTDVVFVSGEEKSDWVYKSQNRVLYPRFELVSEFCARSKGCSFHLVGYSYFLELIGASAALTEQIREIEDHTAVALDNIQANAEASRYRFQPFDQGDQRWTSSYRIISEDDFLRELEQSQLRLEFVGLNHFIHNHLGISKGYDFRNSHSVKDKLISHGIVESYTHYPENDQYYPIEAIRIAHKG